VFHRGAYRLENAKNNGRTTSQGCDILRQLGHLLASEIRGFPSLPHSRFGFVGIDFSIPDSLYPDFPTRQVILPPAIRGWLMLRNRFKVSGIQSRISVWTWRNKRTSGFLPGQGKVAKNKV
jgi:hypothetical protein